ADSVLPADVPEQILIQLLRPSAASTPDSVRALARDLGGRTWVRFHWPKTIMPHPFWSEERRQEFVGFYGGSDEPGYVHNVLGLPGDPEYTLFPERLLKPALTWIPDYLTVSFRWDARAGQLDALSRRLNPAYPWGEEGELQAAVVEDLEEDQEETESPADALQPYLTVLQDTVDLTGWDHWNADRRRQTITDLARFFVRPIAGDLTAGEIGRAS